MSFEVLILSLGCFLAAFCSGMAGFAFNLVAAGILFHFLSPQTTAPVLVLGSLLVQLLSLRAVWPLIEWRRLRLYLVAGALGTPLGLLMLGWGNAGTIVAGVGALLVVYAGYMLLRLALRRAPPQVAGGAVQDGVIGFASGILGGIGGFSGALPAMWSDIQGLPKDRTRAMIQPFVAIMQAVAAIGLALGGFFTRESGLMLATALPALLLGTWLGLHAYTIIPAQGFRVALLVLLLLSGLSLLA